MDGVRNVLLEIRQILNFPVFKLGESEFTAWGIFLFVVLLILLLWVSAKAKKWIVGGLLSRSHLDVGARHAVASIASYVFLAIGFVIILQTAGINLSALTILVGSLSIGIGLGLQNITNNFVSGLILLFERPIKVGDRIEFGSLNGDVVKIAARATTIVTNDNISVIVPNSELITSPVINWSNPNPKVRLNFPIGVAYGTDPELVKKLLLEIAYQHPGVLKEPPADVLLDNFGDSAINFILRVWSVSYLDRPNVLKSDLYYAIANVFKEHAIEIPFPQRDVHIHASSDSAAP